MAVDYRLQSRFVASRRRYDAARLALPERWRSDPRPEAQIINDHWVSVIAETRKHLERLGAAAAKTEHDPRGLTLKPAAITQESHPFGLVE